jgi:hypothetical protein
MSSISKNKKNRLRHNLQYRLKNGRAKWIRTIEMTESKSVALPLGYSPIDGGGGRIRTIEL